MVARQMRRHLDRQTARFSARPCGRPFRSHPRLRRGAFSPNLLVGSIFTLGRSFTRGARASTTGRRLFDSAAFSGVDAKPLQVAQDAHIPQKIHATQHRRGNHRDV